ncbi:PTPA-CTERM sorting domain-containing protein [Nodosilinea sp. LEGE 07088]|uniref:PTPA-CTERM sorting domain-containing protein n=1 Tax=Nodosilinea sp. LEGE 07088 TaxID=2777968 RepID=UPI0018828D07|nr:PTPA-CTERM sorting domain-containing protein [Nodosilinea sp. LEGE 07088]MBE9138776.1 PTPA-CTERM sorting domain-containing protein [Nodosilinea sp. LEGE 07088]
MTIRALGLGLGAAVAFSAVAVLEAPVQAATIEGKTLDFGGAAKLVDTSVGGIATLDFAESPAGLGTPGGTVNNVSLGTAAFGGFNSIFSISDLQLEKTSDTTWVLSGGPVVWLSGLANGIGFTLEAFDLTQNPSSSFEALISGFFTPSGLAGSGSLTAQGGFKLNGTSFSADITAIPTPALLPGLVGLGFAALRKRKQEDAEQEA